MSRANASFAEGTALDPSDGGYIRAGEGDVIAPEIVGITPTGGSFGPLYLGVPEDEIVTVESLSFGPGENTSLIPLMAGGGVLAATNTRGERRQADTPEEKQTTRRGALALFATILGVGAVGKATADDNDLVTLQVAHLEVSNLSGPLSVRILDVVDDVLPPTTDLLVDARETRVGKISDPGEGVQLPASTQGEMRVYLEDSLGNLTQIFAWIRSLLPGDDTSIAYERELPQDAAEYDEGEFVRLSDHPAIVEPVRGDASRTRLSIGATNIPHEDDGADNGAGSYGVLDDALIYTVGDDAPAAAEWKLETQLGWIEAQLN